jgi:hypothetical protein
MYVHTITKRYLKMHIAQCQIKSALKETKKETMYSGMLHVPL